MVSVSWLSTHSGTASDGPPALTRVAVMLMVPGRLVGSATWATSFQAAGCGSRAGWLAGICACGSAGVCSRGLSFHQAPQKDSAIRGSRGHVPDPELATLASPALKGVVRERAIALEAREVRQESRVTCHHLGWLLRRESARPEQPHRTLVGYHAEAAGAAAGLRPGWLLPGPRWERLLGNEVAGGLVPIQGHPATGAAGRRRQVVAAKPAFVVDEVAEIGRRAKGCAGRCHDGDQRSLV